MSRRWGRIAWERGNTNAGGSLSYLPPVNLSNSWQHYAVVSDPAGGVGRLRQRRRSGRAHHRHVQQPGQRVVFPDLRELRRQLHQHRATLRNVFRSDAAWGDYNRDGWRDILLAGEAASAPVTNTLVYRSLGPGGFTNVAINPGTRRAAVAWGDVDRDSELDFAVAGATNTAGGDRSWSGAHNRVSGDDFVFSGFTPIQRRLPCRRSRLGPRNPT